MLDALLLQLGTSVGGWPKFKAWIQKQLIGVLLEVAIGPGDKPDQAPIDGIGDLAKVDDQDDTTDPAIWPADTF